MEYATISAESLVKAANQGEYAVPEFQRGFVWTPTQVLEFAESLSRNFPVGSILTWKSNTAIQRGDSDQARLKSWLIDGQQRTTALNTLFGRQPDWWEHNHSGPWKEHLDKFDIRLDIGVEELTFVTRKSSSRRYVKIREILNSDNLFSFAQNLVSAKVTYTDDTGEIAKRLQQVANIKNSTLPVVQIGDEIELTDVAEIFKRLNSTGTRVQQADIYLGVVASRNLGWVNRNFLKFQKDLEASGFEIEPAFLFRAFTAIAAGKSRFRDIDPNFWDNLSNSKGWASTKNALQSVCQGLREYGIIKADLVLSLNALVAAAVYRAKYSQGSFGPILAWILCAIKDGFFSGPTETKLDRVITAIQEADSKDAALKNLYQLLDINPDKDVVFTDKDFLDTGSSRNSVERLLIYLIAFNNDAEDWSTDGYHIRSQSSSPGPYSPEWHHIFPRKCLKDAGIDNKDIDLVVNMAVISGDANRKIAASVPKKYIAEFNLASRGLLEQQAIPDPSTTTPKQYKRWLNRRAKRLAQESNNFLAELRHQA